MSSTSSSSIPFKSLWFLSCGRSDQTLIREAFKENKLPYQLFFFADPGEAERTLVKSPAAPALIFFDLDHRGYHQGLGQIAALKTAAFGKTIPIIVLSSVELEEQVHGIYTAGATSLMMKPATFTQLHEALTLTLNYWLKTVRLA